MRKFFLTLLILALLGLAAAYGYWAALRPNGHYLSDLRIQLALDQGTPSERGNLLGVQPELFPGDYQDPARLRRKLEAYLQQARALGLLNPKTIVILPEHVGTWLWIKGEKDEVYQARGRDEAFQWLSLSNPLRFAKAWLSAKDGHRGRNARLRMKADEMAADYQALFGGLAKEFGITLVAGSIVLPSPHIEDGLLVPGNGSLFNISLVFGADGKPIGQPQHQVFPDRDNRRLVEQGSADDLDVIDTPAGRLGVLLGTDSWYPDNYRRLQAKGVQVLAIPAFIAGPGNWQTPWRGYSLRPPADALLQPGAVSNEQAWQRLTLAGMATLPDVIGLSVFMHGRFWDVVGEGQTFLAHDGQAEEAPAGPGARLINLWL
jgi:hypothetical protein